MPFMIKPSLLFVWFIILNGITYSSTKFCRYDFVATLDPTQQLLPLVQIPIGQSRHRNSHSMLAFFSEDSQQNSTGSASSSSLSSTPVAPTNTNNIQSTTETHNIQAHTTTTTNSVYNEGRRNSSIRSSNSSSSGSKCGNTGFNCTEVRSAGKNIESDSVNVVGSPITAPPSRTSSGSNVTGIIRRSSEISRRTGTGTAGCRLTTVPATETPMRKSRRFIEKLQQEQQQEQQEVKHPRMKENAVVGDNNAGEGDGQLNDGESASLAAAGMSTRKRSRPEKSINPTEDKSTRRRKSSSASAATSSHSTKLSNRQTESRRRSGATAVAVKALEREGKEERDSEGGRGTTKKVPRRSRKSS
jgi:hypothetical protein